MDAVITPAAEKFIRRMLRMAGSANAGFRLVVTAGGCSGLAGDFSIESAPLAGDGSCEIQGIKFFLPMESRLLLAGVTIDFADTPTQTGLVLRQSKAAAGGCASSAGAAGPPDIASISPSSIVRRPAATSS